MRNPILATVLAVLLVLLLALSGITLAKWAGAYEQLQMEAKNLRAERDLLLVKLETAEKLAGHLVAQSAVAPSEVPAVDLDLAAAAAPTNSVNLWAVRPDITTDERGRKSYFFGELYGAKNQVIARDAQFEELLGFTKLAFRTSQGTRYYDLDDLHPEVIRSLGYDATVLKRRLAAENRQRQILGAQAKLQAELRAQAAAERLKAEAALRDAEARERLADAAERAATNPPKQRITQKVVVVSPYARIITNSPPKL